MKKYQNKRKLGKHINCFISQNAKEVLERYLKSKKLNITECIENLILELDPNKENLKARDFYESLFKVISINQHVYRELMANSNNLNQLTKNTNIAIKYNKPFYLQNLAFLEEIFKVMDTLNKNVEECKKISLELLLQIYKEQKSQTEFNAISKILNALNEKQSTTEPKKDNA
ncbi:replication regulatory RepB family protein [Helicobacter pylori]|uniref:replication regulatory RepB family protein n=1 Tax=Helicobacter pylori TaxID=210 RepID=UPI000EAFAA99|nr:replication regulatory RepB family protein [Helicobacter pylori]RVY45393.1 replication regulatory RepB family protein [Helicobacter pylori]UOS41641.1 replication regulatory RepB family protein [Helicobacter pylori]UOS62224.1 replication regulatory RepB family protein [Helicobacter pylori]UOS71717.1 replication regulatory RepB family protein [Helicobacter pylori]UOS71763.1 replication regulatory RepB family protein [Helicobacter pylori]